MEEKMGVKSKMEGKMRKNNSGSDGREQIEKEKKVDCGKKGGGPSCGATHGSLE